MGVSCFFQIVEYEIEEIWIVLYIVCEGEDMDVSFIEFFEGVSFKVFIVGGGFVFF